jgi:hypothetical protein
MVAIVAVVVKVTTAFGITAPAASVSVAFTVAGELVEMLETEAPVESTSEILIDPVAVVVVVPDVVEVVPAGGVDTVPAAVPAGSPPQPVKKITVIVASTPIIMVGTLCLINRFMKFPFIRAQRNSQNPHTTTKVFSTQ